MQMYLCFLWADNVRRVRLCFLRGCVLLNSKKLFGVMPWQNDRSGFVDHSESVDRPSGR